MRPVAGIIEHRAAPVLLAGADMDATDGSVKLL